MSTQNWIVSKFGGSSMADSVAMNRSALVALKQGAHIVVVSATYGTTNQLVELGRLVLLGTKEAREQQKQIVQDILNRHNRLAEELALNAEGRKTLERLYKELQTIVRGAHLLKDLSSKAQDTLFGLGERLSSVLFTQALSNQVQAQAGNRPVQLFDARLVMKTDNKFGKAQALIEKIREAALTQLLPLLESNLTLVTQGYIGQTLDGHNTTLGRGGSDYSAALFAEAIRASMLEIWTDVAGIATTDPRLCPEARLLEEITFMEASELAIFGAKVLHPTTLQPAMRQDIPVFVGSSIESDRPGTTIRHQTTETPLIRAMAIRSKQSLLTLTTPQMWQGHGFLYNVFKVFNDHKISIDSVTTSEISVSLTLDDATLLNEELLNDLRLHAEVEVEDNLALVSLIGNNINHTPGLARTIFQSIDDINVRMICLGASRHNFCFLVPEGQSREAITRLHRTFIEQASHS
jgi:aspartate kinase